MSLKQRYQKLASGARDQFLSRARHNALLTLPSVMPLEGHDHKSHLVEPYQGLGAKGATHLASRLLVAFLPAGRPAIRLDVPAQTRMQTKGEVDSATEKGLALSEQLIMSEIEAKGWRSSTLMSLLQQIITGNVLEHEMPDSRLRIFRLDQYVVRRDFAGTFVELITEETFKLDTVPLGLAVPDKTGRKEDDDIFLHTKVELVEEGGVRFYRRTQEIDDVQVGDTATWSIEDVPYFPLRWASTPGEDYGRSKVEEHIGDLRALESLEKAALEMAAMAARHFIMVTPSASAAGLKNRIARAINGAVLTGVPDTVEMKGFDVSAGFAVTDAQLERTRASLAQSFLLLSGGQRQAERVTAAEIERDINELESALGGVFSMLSTDMMQRRVHVLIKNMQREAKLPQWTDDMVRPTVLMGLEALSRERDVGKAVTAGQIVQGFGESAVDVVKLNKIIGKAFVGLGFADSVRSDEEVAQIQQQRQQAQQQQAIVDKAAGPVAGALAQGAVQPPAQ